MRRLPSGAATHNGGGVLGFPGGQGPAGEAHVYLIGILKSWVFLLEISHSTSRSAIFFARANHLE